MLPCIGFAQVQMSGPPLPVPHFRLASTDPLIQGLPLTAGSGSALHTPFRLTALRGCIFQCSPLLRFKKQPQLPPCIH